MMVFKGSIVTVEAREFSLDQGSFLGLAGVFEYECELTPVFLRYVQYYNL